MYLDIHSHNNRQSAKIGMWLFLLGELILFGGLFLLYAVYRMKYPLDFHHAASDLNTYVGTVNTLLLLTSSLTAALAIAALERGNKRLATTLLSITITFGVIFLVNKYFEWGAKFDHGIFPNSPILENRQDGEILFYGLYFTMTGIHGIHVLLGIFFFIYMQIQMIRNPFEKISIPAHELRELKGSKLCLIGPDNETIWDGGTIDESHRYLGITIAYDDERIDKINQSTMTQLENYGLYWHLVDIIWIFLFPLFYLIT